MDEEGIGGVVTASFAVTPGANKCVKREEEGMFVQTSFSMWAPALVGGKEKDKPHEQHFCLQPTMPGRRNLHGPQALFRFPKEINF